MTRYRAAVIGLGRIASTFDDEIETFDIHGAPHAHIACYAAAPEIEIVGLADTWEEQREAARRRWGIDAVFADYRQMLRDTKPDIVSVCTSAKPRADIMLEIANGSYGVRAVRAEKPLCFSLQEADAVIEACRSNHIIVSVNCVRRWHPIFRRALALIEDGWLGDVQHVQALGQCVMTNNGSHLLTTLTMFARARADWVMGETESAAVDDDADFEAAGYVAFGNGVRGYFRSFAHGPDRHTGRIEEWEFSVTGTGGMIRLVQDGRAPELWTAEEPRPGMNRIAMVRRTFPVPATARSASLEAVYDLLACIERGAEPRCTAEDAREALEIAIATRESHRRGNVRVDLPLPDRSLQIIEPPVYDIPKALQR